MTAGLLLWPGVSGARGAKDARIFKSFVREVKVGSRFFGTGPKGQQDLEGPVPEAIHQQAGTDSRHERFLNC